MLISFEYFFLQYSFSKSYEKKKEVIQQIKLIEIPIKPNEVLLSEAKKNLESELETQKILEEEIKAEELRKEKKLKEKIETQKREQEKLQKAEAETEKLKEEEKKSEKLEKEKKLKEKIETQKKEQEKLQKTKVEAEAEKRKEEKKKAEELRKEKEKEAKEKAQAEAEKRKEEQEKAEELKKEKEKEAKEKADAEAEKRKKAEAEAKHKSFLNGLRAGYIDNVREEIEKNKKYPILSKSKNEEGIVLLSFRIDKNGKIDNLRIQKSSGFEKLDEAALKAVQSGNYKDIPNELEEDYLDIQVPIKFNLN